MLLEPELELPLELLPELELLLEACCAAASLAAASLAAAAAAASAAAFFLAASRSSSIDTAFLNLTVISTYSFNTNPFVSPSTIIFAHSLSSRRISKLSSPDTRVRTALSVLLASRTLKVSVLIVAILVPNLSTSFSALKPIASYSDLMYPSTWPDVI